MEKWLELMRGLERRMQQAGFDTELTWGATYICLQFGHNGGLIEFQTEAPDRWRFVYGGADPVITLENGQLYAFAEAQAAVETWWA